MSDDSVVERAVRVLELAWNDLKAKWPSHAPVRLTFRQEVEAFHAAGLLASDLHERALAACEASAADVRQQGIWPEDLCKIIGRESLAAKKPKERFFVHRSPNTDPASCSYSVVDRTNGTHMLFRQNVAYATACCDALNNVKPVRNDPESVRMEASHGHQG